MAASTIKIIQINTDIYTNSYKYENKCRYKINSQLESPSYPRARVRKICLVSSSKCQFWNNLACSWVAKFLLPIVNTCITSELSFMNAHHCPLSYCQLGSEIQFRKGIKAVKSNKQLWFSKGLIGEGKGGGAGLILHWSPSVSATFLCVFVKCL